MILITVKRTLAAALALLLSSAVASCGSPGEDDSGLLVVTSTTVLGDLVAAIAGEDATVEVLLPLGADPHDFQPSARQMSLVATADLVIINGLGLEEQLEDAIAAAADSEVVVLAIAAELDPLPWSDAGMDSTDHESDHGDLDPHVWLDPVRMADAARLVGSALAALDPAGGYRARSELYATALLDADTEIRGILADIPPQDRLLVTNHDSFAYFAARYGFEVVGVVIPGGSTLAEPSSAEMAALVALIRERGVKAVFAETTHPTDLAEAIAAEAGTAVAVVELFSGSLGEPGTPAATLPGMLLENARRIAAALGG
jgi:zinc/manganese transport system substrate-binding protein